ncbi:MAG: efflux RND transporter periplasmic adaptor subunit [Acidobacteria bacterium]|nr:MAG: efflux RND transporter periplasmic adaptor subunit [Acidobacteriota bacterium]
MRKSLLIVVAVAVLAGGGYAYYQYRQKPPAPTINTARVTRGDLAEAVGATGTLQAVTTVQVGTQVSGTIQQLNADFNSLVHKGQVLARLDPSLFQTQIEQARANLIRAEADLERLRVALDDAKTKLNRARELSEKKLIAQTELEAADVAVRSAEAQLRSQQAAVTQSTASLQQNQVNLQHTVIESPIDGLVISRNVDVGQTVAASMSAPTLFVLAADLTKMQVLASLDESDVGRIRPGQVVRFRVDAYPNDEFTGSVTQVRLQPTTVQNVVTYQTVIDVPNPQLKLKPGMTATVNIEIARRTDVLRMPNTALRFRPTNEIFTALGQTPPPAGGGRGGGAGSGPDTRNTQPAPQPGAQQQPTTRERPAAQPRATQPGAGNDTTSNVQRPAPATASVAPPLRGIGDRFDTETASGNSTGRRGGRGSFQERLASMTPEDRARFTERMRARGVPVPEGQAAAGSQAGRGQGPVAVAQRAPAAPAQSGATTFDALFPPLTPTESFGQVWLNVGGKLQRVRLRLGITDGQQTELIQALDGTIQEGTEVVVTVTTGAVRQTTTPQGSNAFPGLTGGRGFDRGGRRGGG